MQIFKCFSSRMAHYLLKAGFAMIGQEPNLKNPKYDVFLFIDSPQLREKVTEYSNNPFNKN